LSLFFTIWKIQALKHAEEDLKQAAEKLAAKQEQLSQVEAQVERLQKDLEEKEAEQLCLIEQASVTENRLIRAEKLTAALGDEAVMF
jgi:dynein heavy chain